VKNRDLVGGIGQIMFEMDYPACQPTRTRCVSPKN
jgi:hypothetical protein